MELCTAVGSCVSFASSAYCKGGKKESKKVMTGRLKVMREALGLGYICFTCWWSMQDGGRGHRPRTEIVAEEH